MVTQHSNYSTVPTDVKNIIASKVSLLDKYIIMCTGDNEYTALIYNPPTKNTVQYRVYRQGQSYTNSWNIQRVNEVEFEYQVSNEYYVVSNVGYGQMMDLPVYEATQSFFSCTMVAIAFFAIIFKGVLFKCLKRKK